MIKNGSKQKLKEYHFKGRPGFGIRLNVKVINKIKALILPKLNKLFCNMSFFMPLSDQNWIFEIRKVDLILDPIKPKQIVVGNASNEFFFFTIRDLNVKAKIKVFMNLFFRETDVDISICGHIDQIKFMLKFKDLDPDNPIPQFESSLGSYTFDKSSFEIKINTSGIIAMFFNKALFTYTEVVLKMVEKQEAKICEAINASLNSKIKKDYPSFFQLKDFNLRMNSKLANKIEFKDDSIFILFEGTFFNEDRENKQIKKESYQSFKYNPKRLLDFMISEYSANSLFDAFSHEINERKKLIENSYLVQKFEKNAFKMQKDQLKLDLRVKYKEEKTHQNCPIVDKNLLIKVYNIKIRKGLLDLNVSDISTKELPRRKDCESIFSSQDKFNKKLKSVIADFLFFCAPYVGKKLHNDFDYLKDYYNKLPNEILKPYGIRISSGDVNISEKLLCMSLNLKFFDPETG